MQLGQSGNAGVMSSVGGHTCSASGNYQGAHMSHPAYMYQNPYFMQAMSQCYPHLHMGSQFHQAMDLKLHKN